jgi:hypothetical protein
VLGEDAIGCGMKYPINQVTIDLLVVTLQCIRRNKGCTIDFLRFEIRDEPLSKSRVQDLTRELCRQGVVIRAKDRAPGKFYMFSFNEGTPVIQYEAEQRPVRIKLPVKRHAKKVYMDAAKNTVRRVDAVQMGMVRDPLVAALYGAAGRVA